MKDWTTSRRFWPLIGGVAVLITATWFMIGSDRREGKDQALVTEGTTPKEVDADGQLLADATVNEREEKPARKVWGNPKEAEQALSQLWEERRTPREIALSFYQLTQHSLKDASSYLQNPPEWLELEVEGLQKVLLEEVVRQEGAEALELYLVDLFGGMDEREAKGEMEMHHATLAESPGLNSSLDSFLQTMVTANDEGVRKAAQSVDMQRTLEKRGWQAALQKANVYGVSPVSDDSRFNELVGLASRTKPKELKAWLANQADPSVQKAYEPFLAGLLGWYADGVSE